ncbi:MAG: OsmC family protein [Silicimonas sp.]|nr:OsmC family protein [Silicimonas sp.]
MHTAEVIWTCEGDFAKGTYSRGHIWRFDGGLEVPGSASPSVVPAPYSVAAAVDPEEAYIASLSSCHMLWFLDLAKRNGLSVAAYHDQATGALVSEGGRMWIPRVDLNISVDFDDAVPDKADHRALHEKAHRACFIANSVKTEVVINLKD